MRDSTSADTERSKPMSPAWRRTIAELVRSDPNLRINTLAHRLTLELLEAAYRRLNRNAAPGPDGVTVAEYGEDLQERLEVLHEQLKTGQYRASAARRVYIPKPNGKQRPLGIANVEDRIVQTAIAMLLEPIYEEDFLDFSYGFRPGRSAKDALERVRTTVNRQRVRVVYEADIRGFFDHLDHSWLRKFVAHRVADRRVLRLIGKVLKSGVVEDGKVVRSRRGTPQGGPLSPLLANIYLHYVLDLWFDRRFRRTCRGVAELVRYADDFVVCFEHPEEAERFSREVVERFAAFGLDLVPEKTRLVEFGKGLKKKGPGPDSGRHTFEFLGFTHYMRRRKHGLITARKPSARSRTRFLLEVKLWLKRHMHRSPWFHLQVLNMKLRGFYVYFGLRYCRAALRHIRFHVERLWYRTLCRRSQKAWMSWARIKLKPWFNLLHPQQVRSRPKRSKRRALGEDVAFHLMLA